MLGAGTIVKLEPLLALPETVTTTLPEVAPEGTVATILVALQVVTLAVVPLNCTMLVPCDEPKVVPAIVTEPPIATDEGVKLVILGVTVKLDPLLFTPLANTTTFPGVAADGTVTAILVALQLETLAAVPLKLTVPDP